MREDMRKEHCDLTEMTILIQLVTFQLISHEIPSEKAKFKKCTA